MKQCQRRLTKTDHHLKEKRGQPCWYCSRCKQIWFNENDSFRPWECKEGGTLNNKGDANE